MSLPDIPLHKGNPLENNAENLRTAFDQAFAAPLQAREAHLQAFLGIRLSGDPYALRLDEISSLLTNKPITALPGDTPHLLGIGGFRGNLVPVYDLRGLMGYPISRAPARSFAGAKGWLVLTAQGPPSRGAAGGVHQGPPSRGTAGAVSEVRVAYAFGELDGQLHVSVEAIVPETGRRHISAVLVCDGVKDRPVLDLLSLTARLAEPVPPLSRAAGGVSEVPPLRGAAGGVSEAASHLPKREA